MKLLFCLLTVDDLAVVCGAVGGFVVSSGVVVGGNVVVGGEVVVGWEVVVVFVVVFVTGSKK